MDSVVLVVAELRTPAKSSAGAAASDEKVPPRPNDSCWEKHMLVGTQFERLGRELVTKNFPLMSITPVLRSIPRRIADSLYRHVERSDDVLLGDRTSYSGFR